MKECVFEVEMKVRDYECDIQGIVNNANYQHYIEHARHEFLRSFGADFAQLHRDGVDAVVSKIAIEYKQSLVGGERFVCKIRISKKGPKMVFYQDIFSLDNHCLAARAEVDVVIKHHGQLTRGEYFDILFKDFL
ncbi:thioesterase [Bacteroidales bacterium]|nr:thioesterase [Bacteroidales bacterium]